MRVRAEFAQRVVALFPCTCGVVNEVMKPASIAQLAKGEHDLDATCGNPACRKELALFVAPQSPLVIARPALKPGR